MEEERVRGVLKHGYTTLLRMQVLQRAESLVGAEDTAGQRLSGGERKRVSIGVELVARPRVLFCDEITSGLDASTSLQVMRYLAKLARKEGLTVCAVLHQPRVEIADVCDHLVLLVRGGRVVYDGPFSDTKRFLSNLGFDFPEGSSRVDVYMDVSTGTATSSLFPHRTGAEWADTWQRVQVRAEVLARALEASQEVERVRRRLDRASRRDPSRAALEWELAEVVSRALGPRRTRSLAYVLLLTDGCSRLQRHLGLRHMQACLDTVAMAKAAAAVDAITSPKVVHRGDGSIGAAGSGESEGGQTGRAGQMHGWNAQAQAAGAGSTFPSLDGPGAEDMSSRGGSESGVGVHQSMHGVGQSLMEWAMLDGEGVGEEEDEGGQEQKQSGV